MMTEWDAVEITHLLLGYTSEFGGVYSVAVRAAGNFKNKMSI